MVLKHVAKVVISFGEAVGKAFSRAVREEYNASKQAASTASSSHSSAKEATRTNAKMGITLEESIKILDVKQPLDRENIEQRYRHLFEINDRSKGGTLYLQSKVFRAKERIDKELAALEERTKSEENREIRKE